MAFYCLCLLICTAIAAPFHTSVMGKNTNFTLIAFTGQQEPDQSTFPSLCSLSCLSVTICSRLPYTRTTAFAPCGRSHHSAGHLCSPEHTTGSQTAPFPRPTPCRPLYACNQWKCFHHWFSGESPAVKSLTNQKFLFLLSPGGVKSQMEHAGTDEFQKGFL